MNNLEFIRAAIWIGKARNVSDETKREWMLALKGIPEPSFPAILETMKASVGRRRNFPAWAWEIYEVLPVIPLIEPIKEPSIERCYERFKNRVMSFILGT